MEPFEPNVCHLLKGAKGEKEQKLNPVKYDLKYQFGEFLISALRLSLLAYFQSIFGFVEEVLLTHPNEHLIINWQMS